VEPYSVEEERSAALTSITPLVKTLLVVSNGSVPSLSEKRRAGGAKRAIVPVPVRSGRVWPVVMMVRMRSRYWCSSCRGRVLLMEEDEADEGIVAGAVAACDEGTGASD
jgi:hypothetical protein